ncbi:MAG: hypothetical protein WAV04_03950 [Candidatus Microsaccharimonas sp.]
MLSPWDKGFEPPKHWRNRELANLSEEEFQAAQVLTLKTLRKELWKALLRLPIALIKGDRKVTIRLVEIDGLWILALPFLRNENLVRVDGYSDAYIRCLTTHDNAEKLLERFARSFRFLDFSHSIGGPRYYFIEVPTAELRRIRRRLAANNRAYFRAKRRNERQLARQSR